jgi:hypothetical protein
MIGSSWSKTSYASAEHATARLRCGPDSQALLLLLLY